MTQNNISAISARNNLRGKMMFYCIKNLFTLSANLSHVRNVKKQFSKRFNYTRHSLSCSKYRKCQVQFNTVTEFNQHVCQILPDSATPIECPVSTSLLQRNPDGLIQQKVLMRPLQSLTPPPMLPCIHQLKRN